MSRQVEPSAKKIGTKKTRQISQISKKESKKQPKEALKNHKAVRCSVFFLPWVRAWVCVCVCVMFDGFVTTLPEPKDR